MPPPAVPPQQSPGRAHPLWAVAALLSAAVALAVGTWAVLDHYLASRPVGEGELFAAEVTGARAEYLAQIAEGADPEVEVRRIRNGLKVESVSITDGDGFFRHSTSPNWVDRPLTGFLAGALERGSFAAIAEPIQDTVTIDGIPEWEPGEILYRVLAPFDEGGGIVVEYDITALLARRARLAAVQPIHVAAGVASIAMLAGSAILVLARQGAQRRASQAALRRHYLEQRSTELEEHNRLLDEARSKAERALALAEETNRIRSEFVLMINHELRTPLTSIVTGSELLAGSWEELEPPTRLSLLQDVVADGRRLKELITQMLVVARIENRSLQYELRHVRTDTLRSRLAGLTPRTSLWSGETELPPLLTDVDTLAHLLVSLADNARTHGASLVDIKVSEHLPFDPMVEVGTRPKEALYFLICDNGPGIDTEFISHIFEKFEKRGRASGTGLGLYLAKVMVEGIEGSISVATGQQGTVMAVGVPRWTRQVARVAS
jgi:signal transduction histidine kinase